nr:IS200/IS605 family transposase [Thiocapsa sp.]
MRRQIGAVLRELCQQPGVEIVEGHAMPDHIHQCLSIPPKFSVANTVGFLKGESAIRIRRQFLGQKRNFTGLHFWARGYCLSTIGLDEAPPSAGSKSRPPVGDRLRSAPADPVPGRSGALPRHRGNGTGP